MITPDSIFFRFTFYVLPWITYTILTLGVIYQVRKWLSGAPSPDHGERRGDFWGKAKAVFLNIVLQRRLLRRQPRSLLLWVSCWLVFHIPLFFILVGHLRSFDVWSVDWFTWLASEEFLTETLPLVMGFILLSGAVLLLLRRIIFTAPRSISTSGNYIVLLLIIMAIVAGNTMRVLSHSSGEFAVTVPPGFTMELEHTPSLVWFTIHAFIAQVIVIYLPFSGLIHIISSVITMVANSRGEANARRTYPGQQIN